MKIIPIILIFFLFARCGSNGECCECTDCPDDNKGNLKLIRSWNLYEGMKKAEKTEVYFYHSEIAPFHYPVYGDTSYHDLPEGEYNILAFTSSDLLFYQGMDSYLTAEAFLPEFKQDSITMIREVPVICSGNLKIDISGKIKDAVIELRPAFKIINLTIEVVGDVNPGDLISCEGYLSGVQTSFKLCTDLPVNFCLPVKFETFRKKDNIFFKSLRIFGFMDDVFPAFNLKLLVGENLIEKEVTIDEYIDFRSSPIQNVKIKVSVNNLSADVVIEDWQPGVEGNIVF